MKHIFITGTTDGIGKLAAVRFAKEGHTLYLHGRNADKLRALSSQIKAETNNLNIFEYVADFSDLESVKAMAELIKNELSQIDILINNAGVFISSNIRNEAGLDMRFVVNYLAPFIITNALTPLLKKGTEARIINLSSAAQASVSHEALFGKVDLTLNESYAQSKLALTMWSFHLAKALKGITVIAVNPGSLLNTKMANEAYGEYWSPAEKGSDIIYDIAISETHKEITGKYYDNDNGLYANAHPDAYNPTLIQEVIKATELLIE